jgi:hypothetical protein
MDVGMAAFFFVSSAVDSKARLAPQWDAQVLKSNASNLVARI